MAIRSPLVLATAAAVFCAVPPRLAAQGGSQPSRVMVTTSRAHGRAWTGMMVSGRPSQGTDGRPRWAEFPVVRQVVAGSPAARVGIQAGDVLLQVNGADARDPSTLFGQPGKVFTVRVRRGTAVQEFVITSAAPPEAGAAQPAN